MKTYKCVGWYCSDPHDEKSVPYAQVVYLGAYNEHEAYSLGSDMLRELQKDKAYDLMNWYVSEVK